MVTSHRIPLARALIVTAVALGVAAWSSAVSPLGAVSRPQVATPSVSITSMVDGSGPFSNGDGPGEDSSPANRRARAGDVVRLGVKVVPNGVTGATTDTDVIVDVVGSAGLLAWSAVQPVGCSTGGNGVSCNFGRRAIGTPIEFVVDAVAAERAAAGDVSGQINVSAGGAPASSPLVVTAATPSLAAELTAPRFAGTATRGGADGVLVTYGIQLVSNSTTALVSSPAGVTLGLVLDVSATGSGAEVVSCSANGEPGGGYVYSSAVSGRRTAPDVVGTARLADGGAWSCAPQGALAKVTVSGVDTNPSSFPTQSWNQQNLAPSTGVVSAGAVTVFVPNSTIAQSGVADLSASAIAGSVEGLANAGNCPDLGALEAGACGAGAGRQDPLTTSSVGAPTPMITVFHTVDSPIATAGAPLVWRYTVTNTGDVGLSAVTAVDSAGPNPTASADGVLEPGEVWTFELRGVQPAGSLRSTVEVTGTTPSGSTVTATHDVVSTTPPVSTSSQPGTATGSGPAVNSAPVNSAPAANVPAGVVDDKTTLTVVVNDAPFTALPGPLAVVGVPNLIEYEVKNKLASSVFVVIVDDSSITDDATAIDCGLDSVVKNRIPSLPANGTVTCKRTLQPVAGNATFTASVTVAALADAKLDAGFQAKPASLDLELLVNGQDADTPPGPSVSANSLLTFGYTLRNTGQIDLGNLFVSHVGDEAGVFDDISCAALNDDTGGDATVDLLKVGQTVNCTFTVRAITGAFSTQATAVGNPLSPAGDDLTNEDGSIEVTDTDALNYTGVATGTGTTATTQPAATTVTTVPGTIGDGGSNSFPVVLAASGMFVAGFGLWGFARRRRWFDPAR